VPKIKTHRGTAKRIKVSATGKIQHEHQFSGCHHILTKKSSKRKRHFRKTAIAAPGDARRIRALVPYLA